MHFPTHVEVLDVTPRDGLQDAAGELSTDEKVHLVRQLSQAGIHRIEVTAFVSPRWVPRMSDAEQVALALEDIPGRIALIPNAVGFERAVRCGVNEVSYVVSASPKHQMDNLRMTLEDSWENLRKINQLRSKTDVKIRGGISCAFRSPFSNEEILPEHVASIAETFKTMGASEISLADTVGLGTPQIVAEVIQAVRDRVPDLPIALHLHDRYQLGQANVTVALLCGVTTIEVALGGLGGCPFAPNAPGNLNAEHLVDWLEKMGIGTGVNPERLAEIRRVLLEQLNRVQHGREVVEK